MPTDAQYQRLLRFRTRLRQFEKWSSDAAEQFGVTHAQHQLMLAIRGSAEKAGPTIGEVAEALLIQHHTASGLVDRTQELGMIQRVRDQDDTRRVRLLLTDRGDEVLQRLTSVHMEELRRLGPLLEPLD